MNTTMYKKNYKPCQVMGFIPGMKCKINIKKTNQCNPLHQNTKEEMSCDYIN